MAYPKTKSKADKIVLEANGTEVFYYSLKKTLCTCFCTCSVYLPIWFPTLTCSFAFFPAEKVESVYTHAPLGRWGSMAKGKGW